VTISLLCFVCGRCEFLFVRGKYESNTKQKSAVVIKKQFGKVVLQTLPKSALQKFFIAMVLTVSTFGEPNTISLSVESETRVGE